jgi:hypothetical protein
MSCLCPHYRASSPNLWTCFEILIGLVLLCNVTSFSYLRLWEYWALDGLTFACDRIYDSNTIIISVSMSLFIVVRLKIPSVWNNFCVLHKEAIDCLLFLVFVAKKGVEIIAVNITVYYFLIVIVRILYCIFAHYFFIFMSVIHPAV